MHVETLTRQCFLHFAICLRSTAILVATCLAAVSTFAAEPQHGYSYFSDLKYPSDMPHFDYVNPNAPQGGSTSMGIVGTFNSFNHLSDKGVVGAYVGGAMMYDSLMRTAEDQHGTYYALLADSILVADDLSWVQYTLREGAYWHDGVPITMEDILWTFDLYKNRASYGLRSSYRPIDRVERTGPRSFRFIFGDDVEKTRHLVSQTATFTPMPKHYWETRDHTVTMVEPPLGSGPYRIIDIDPGRSYTLKRIPDYWGNDLNVNRGYYNFDRIEVMHFFDKNVMLQALKAGVFDYYRDQNESDVATAYEIEAKRRGLLKKETYQMGNAYGMHYGLVLNMRRPLFQDIRVREALTLAYNFEWQNRVYWYGGMERNHSHFARSGMQARGLPSDEEMALLAPFRNQVPSRVFTHPIEFEPNDAFGRNRDAMMQADKLLKEAGWVVRDQQRVRVDTGERMRFDIIIGYIDHERMMTPYVDSLRRLGIDVSLRRVENNLMVNRLRTYDYDTTMRKIYTFALPYPNRMRFQLTSRYADQPNMQNYSGLKDPVIDFLVEQVAGAATQHDMDIAGRALDRVLRWQFHIIPDGHPVGRHLVYWDRIGHPPLGGEYMNWTGFPHIWWFDAEKDARVKQGLAALEEEE